VPEQKVKIFMSAEQGTVDWAAALADIEARIAKLQATADTIREVLLASGSPTLPGGGGPRHVRLQLPAGRRDDPAAKWTDQATGLSR
jgi:hypothetical protein